jgi:hypothetical protein
MGRKRLDLVGQQFGKWTVLEFAGHRGFNGTWRCRCECGTIKVIRREVLIDTVKGSCDRCAKLAKPAFQKVAQWRAQGIPQVEMARRLGTKKQRIGIMLDLIEGRQQKRRSKTHCPQGHSYTTLNTAYDRHGWRHCRTCAMANGKARRRAQKAKRKHREPHR